MSKLRKGYVPIDSKQIEDARGDLSREAIYAKMCERERLGKGRDVPSVETLGAWEREQSKSTKEELLSVYADACGKSLDSLTRQISDKQTDDHSLRTAYIRQGLNPVVQKVPGNLYQDFSPENQSIALLWADARGKGHMNANVRGHGKRRHMRLSFLHDMEWPPNVTFHPNGQVAMPVLPGSRIAFRAKSGKAPKGKQIVISVRVMDRYLQQWTHARALENQQMIPLSPVSWREVVIDLWPTTGDVAWRAFRNDPNVREPDFTIITGLTIECGCAAGLGERPQPGAGVVLIEPIRILRPKA